MPVDVRRELEEAPLRPFHGLLAALVALATTFDGFELIAPAYTIHYVLHPWHLTPGQAGLLTSSGLVGFMAGSLVHGAVADRVGRRPTFLGGLAVASLGSVATAAFAGSFGSFVALRFVSGIGLGVLLPLGFAYLHEFAPRAVQQRLGMAAGLGQLLGFFLAALVGVLLTPAWGWRSLYWLGVVGLAVAAVFAVLLPESVEHLVARGRGSGVAEILARVRPDRAGCYREAGAFTVETDARAGWRETLARGRARRTLGLWLICGLVLFSLYVLTSWTPTLMIERGLGFAGGFTLGALAAGTGILGSLVGAYVADRWLPAPWTIAGASALALLSALLVAGATTPFANLAGIAGLGLCVFGAQTVLNNLCAASYPVRIRATGEGLMLGVGRIGGILGPAVAGGLLGAFHDTGVPYLGVAVASGLAVVVAIAAFGRRRAVALDTGATGG